MVRSEAHNKFFLARLDKVVWATMQDEQCPQIYEPGLVALAKGSAVEEEKDDTEKTTLPVKGILRNSPPHRRLLALAKGARR